MNPFSASGKTVQHMGELALISKIRHWLGPVSPPSPYGIGDDCALIKTCSEQEVISCDSLSYGIHFDATLGAADAGSKLIKRNLSDLAAMGAMPKCAVLAILAGPNLGLDWLESFFTGIRRSCTKYQLALIGGDLSAIAENQFSAVLTLIGEGTTLATRSQASVNDYIYVTGHLGGTRLQKHWAFEPRLQEGRWLATHPDCTALMDLSDGLGKDLAALLPANCQAAIDLPNIPLAEHAHQMAKSSSKTALNHAFTDGEDYELLFTVRASNAASFEQAWQQHFPALPLSRIGQIRPAQCAARYVDAHTGLACGELDGFQHFQI
ncbi:MAG: thiamine-phosphate kinase [Opitutales bacterium]